MTGNIPALYTVRRAAWFVTGNAGKPSGCFSIPIFPVSNIFNHLLIIKKKLY